jgi:hypothetical protein
MEEQDLIQVLPVTLFQLAEAMVLTEEVLHLEAEVLVVEWERMLELKLLEQETLVVLLLPKELLVVKVRKA